ncbi:MAG: uroporphyrinogen-III synthase [Bacteroidetes bacterium]|nr:uroporphyrinogen-III synthase [Bacteroidota bacterium]MBU1115908.1 uroporphyrinogen-III synthase [Bacteroidota bacterium]MBU1798733.1 uroporphyrinogen-III synthase [Bacteroidota bacterium]
MGKINILFTGLSGNDSALQPLINFDKINFIHFPTIEIGKSELSISEKNKIKFADSYDFIIFTSHNAVKYFLQNYGDDYFTLTRKTKIVAIGDKTASLLISKNIDVDFIPKRSSSRSLNELLTEKMVSTKSVLIPCSRLSKVDLSTSLEEKGAMVDFIVVYENKIPKNISNDLKLSISKTDIDLYIFTSPSTFYNFISIYEINDSPNYFANKTIASIGPVTTKAIEKHNVKVSIEPHEYNLSSLTKSILEYYKLN